MGGAAADNTMTQQLDAEHPLTKHLYRKLFATQHGDHFAAQYVDDVDARGFRADDARETLETSDDSGKLRAYLMTDGIAVAQFIGEDGERWAAYETKARVEQRQHLSRWASFARGVWTRECPREPGLYPVVALSAAIPSSTTFAVLTDYQFRRLQRVEGVVRDVTTHCPSTHRTQWAGWWWSEALPMMQAPEI